MYELKGLPRWRQNEKRIDWLVVNADAWYTKNFDSTGSTELKTKMKESGMYSPHTHLFDISISPLVKKAKAILEEQK